MRSYLSYRNIICAAACCLLLFCDTLALGQTIKLTGTVKNKREVLQGAKIKVKQTGKYVVTDADGWFEIDADPDELLQISAKGHQSETIKGGNLSIINVVLAVDSVSLKKTLTKKIKETEPYAHFLQAEKQAVIRSTPAYEAAKWTYLKDVYMEHPHVQSPEKSLVTFITYCKAQNFLNEHEAKFVKAARTLGFELITDASPVNMEAMISNSSAHRNITYTTPNGYGQKLDLFLPKGKSAMPVPCIVFIHDGGWAVHKRAWFEAHARYMAGKGYVTVNIDYRMLDAVTPLQCVYDAKAAVRWVKANARKFNIDTNRIGACGASAGAQLAAILATTGNDPLLDGDVGNLKFSSRIHVAAGFATPTLTGRKTWPIGNTSSLPDWFEKISPYRHVTSDDAPMLFIHGREDNTVAVEEAIDMYNLYKEKGVLTELEIKEGKGHVFYMDMTVVDGAYNFFKKVFN
ncbi:alpha/beta hydrolase fold domain-containing protein [Pedobacter frigoris]|uniref:alpha/beta hydrolase fold domain-containing protein n=1 Tax=Pedobacter frigoris TaxID=2571272 RepID=UPI00292FE8E7|nr:alpha/beta hydrolase fold domain-containing protein [Pedobacter frigoris]